MWCASVGGPKLGGALMRVCVSQWQMGNQRYRRGRMAACRRWAHRAATGADHPEKMRLVAHGQVGLGHGAWRASNGAERLTGRRAGQRRARAPETTPALLPCAAGFLRPTPASCLAPQASSSFGSDVWEQTVFLEHACGHVSETARPELGPRASDVHQALLADRRLARDDSGAPLC